MRCRRSLLAVLLGVALLHTTAWAVGPDYAAMEVQPYEPPKAAPAFALPDLNGKTVRLDEFKGKAVMLVFWATW